MGQGKCVNKGMTSLPGDAAKWVIFQGHPVLSLRVLAPLYLLSM
jgi:hypothetical protein